MNKQQNDDAPQMKAMTPPPPSATSIEGKGPPGGNDPPSLPRRHGMSQWLHDHQQHSPVAPVDTAQEQQQQLQQNASAFMASFLRDAASGHQCDGNKFSLKVPTKMSDSSNKKQNRFVRKNTYGSARSEDSGNTSRSSSIDSLSHSLNEVVRSGTRRGDIIRSDTLTVRAVKTKKSGDKSKAGSRRLPNTSASGDNSCDDDGSVVSNLSDWNELVEKTFGSDDPHSHSHSEAEHVLFDLDKHVSEHIREGKIDPCGEGGDSERNGPGHRVVSTRTTSSLSASTPMATPPSRPKPILKVCDTTDTERLTKVFDSYKTSCTDLDTLEHLLGTPREPVQENDTGKRRNTKQLKPRSRPFSSSTGNVYDEIKDMFIDEGVEPTNSSAEQQKAFVSPNERAQIDRLKKKKTALHRKAFQDSVQSKPADEARSRSSSYDDADRFLWSLEQASAVHKEKTKNDHSGLSCSKLVHPYRGDRDTKSFDAFDAMLAAIEDEEERRMESSLFCSKPKSRQREGEDLLHKQKERDMPPCSSEHDFGTHATDSLLVRNTTKVICLEWVDRRGMVGHFTGEVNSMIQPHGKGILVYENGLVLDCHWCNGTPSAGINDDMAVESQKDHGAVGREKRSNQFHPDYDLGMTARSPHDMQEDSGLEGINNLKALDFAFVRRSNKQWQWTYSIISNRTDKNIRFVVDSHGRTKNIDRNGWLKNIHRIRVQKKCRDQDQVDDHSHRQHNRKDKDIQPPKKKLEP